MPANSIKVQSSEGGEFGCYLALPQTRESVPAVVLASAVHGVDADITAIADEFAAKSFIAAAPDLFWRWMPGPIPGGDPLNEARSTSRIRWHIFAPYRSSMDAPPPWASVMADPTQSSGQSGLATLPAYRAMAARCSTISMNLRP